mmetsp:Transcript_88221/g.205255  ORF Transcript_88221/g.205255 Transcript_88221/m.205255 type:complete len:297 (+) Transcript_88221:88-978(+)
MRESQATDPRRALLQYAQQDAKRRRLGSGTGGNDGGSFFEGPVANSGHLPGVGPSPILFESCKLPSPGNDDIVARIVNALKNHLPSAGENVGLQSGGLQPVPQAAATEPELGDSRALPPPLLGHSSPPREEDAGSDDGVPHRLPPGFGAIPEDLVEERARQREEERVLRLKATQPCRFGRRCKRRDCPNAHPEGRDIDTSLNPCAFGRRCKRKGCFYDHPEGRVIDDDPTKGMCKFGKRCSRPDCLYDHPEGRTPLTGPDPRICFCCHDPGHIASDCPRNPESWNYNREAVTAKTG